MLVGGEGVEGHRDEVGVFILDELFEHLGKPVDRVGGHAGGVGEVPNRVEGPVDVGRAVDQIDRFAVEVRVVSEVGKAHLVAIFGRLRHGGSCKILGGCVSKSGASTGAG